MYYTYLNQDKQLNKCTKLGWLEFAIIVFFSAHYILPSFDAMLPDIIILVAKIGYILYVCGLQPKRTGYILLCFAIFVYLGIIYALLTDTATIDTSLANYKLLSIYSKFTQYFDMFFPFILTFRIAECNDSKKKKWLLAIISLMIVYVIYVTIREIEINPNVTRSWSGFSESSKNNIASYYFVYAIPIVISLLVISFNKCKSFLLKIAIILLIVYSFYFLLKAQYTLALLIAVIGVAMGFIKSTKSNVTKFIVIIATAVLMVFMSDILSFVASKIESRQMAIRFKELADFFTRGDATGYNLGGRLKLYWKSILAFLASPVWGNRRLDFDGHATFLTILSDTGIIGGIPFYYLYFSMKKQISQAIGDNENLFIVPFIMLVLMGLTNPIHAAYPVGFTVWFVVPLIIMIVNENKKVELGGMENE